MPDPRSNTLSKGLRRRGRLIAEALRPPAATALPGRDRPPRMVVKAPANAAPEYVAPPASRLVESPVFLLSPVRSGSTLVRVLLNSHPEIRAPHEMHLRTVHVRMGRDFTSEAMRELELDKDELEHLLWDRVLHLELERSGKRVVVDKTPPNTLIWPRLRRAWPQARYIFLLRHPADVVGSLVNRRRDPDLPRIHAEVLDYCRRLEEARQALSGHTVYYEELTANPERETRAICRHLEVDWDPTMLDYGQRDHGAFRPHIGDWSDKIKSGRIQPARQQDAAGPLPPHLARIAESWGYDAKAG